MINRFDERPPTTTPSNLNLNLNFQLQLQLRKYKLSSHFTIKRYTRYRFGKLHHETFAPPPEEKPFHGNLYLTYLFHTTYTSTYRCLQMDSYASPRTPGNGVELLRTVPMYVCVVDPSPSFRRPFTTSMSIPSSQPANQPTNQKDS